MKTLIFVILIALCSNVHAQENKFTLPVEVSQGFVFENYHNPQWYSVSTTVSPTYTLMNGKLQLSEITKAIFVDGLTDYYAGGGAAYKVYAQKNYNIQLMGFALMGTSEKRLYGGGIKLESGEFFLTATGSQEYSQKKFYFAGGFGITLLK